MSYPTIIKLGGSLLHWEGLNTSLAGLFQSLKGPSAIIVGGGVLAEEIRRWHLRHFSNEEASHWRAVKAMDINADLLRDLCQESQLWTLPFPPWNHLSVSKHPYLLKPTSWLECIANSNFDHDLPRNWNTTSDSISLKLTFEWRCKRLILLKSCDRPAGSWIECAKAGVIDSNFPKLIDCCNNLPQIEWINLRKLQGNQPNL